MRGKWMWGLGILVALGLGLAAGPIRADDGDDDDVKPASKKVPSGGHWLIRWPGGDAKKPADTKPADKTDKPADKPAAKPTMPAAKPIQDPPEKVRAREQAAWVRRQQVCDRLKEVAEQSHDEELLQTAKALEQRSWNLYLQRTANLPASSFALESDAEVVDRHLGPGAADDGRETTTVRTPASKGQGSQTREAEDKP